MSEPFEVTDHDGSELRVAECHQGGHGYVDATDEFGTTVSVCVEPLEVPGLAVALFEAAGQEPPVMIGRPPVVPGRPVVVAGHRLSVVPETGEVLIEHLARGQVASEALLDPAVVRNLAAHLVAYADAAGGSRG